MANYRVFYPVHYIAIGAAGETGESVHGVQSISLNTSFNIEDINELGQIEVYESVEDLPDVELQATKVLDGYPLMYHLATQGSTSASLNSRFNRTCNAILSIFDDSSDSSSGTAISQVLCSGMYVSSLTYTLPTEGSCTEQITLVGNDKFRKTSGFYFTGDFDNTDSPAAADGVQRRENVLMGSGYSVWPTQIPGMTSVGGGSGYNVDSASGYVVHIQDVNISTSPGRTDLRELGRRRPYFKSPNFPAEVTCSISVTAGGAAADDGISANSNANNLSNQAIKIMLSDGTKFNLGDKNKIQSVSYSGGDAGGGNATITYNFRNRGSTLTITNATTDPDSHDQTW